MREGHTGIGAVNRGGPLEASRARLSGSWARLHCPGRAPKARMARDTDDVVVQGMESAVDNPAPASSEHQPSLEEMRALIERVAASDHFCRSARLRDFLLYVGKQSLKEGSPGIHEQEIGAKVFGRPHFYDRTADNIVRVNATELRKRIALYFATEGSHEPLIFEIPRGAYRAVFTRRSSAPAVSGAAQGLVPAASGNVGHEAGPLGQEANSSPGHTAQADDPVQGRGAGRRKLTAVLGCICLCLAGTVAVLLYQNHAMQRQLGGADREPTVASFWARLLRSQNQADIVLSDASVSMSYEIAGRPVSLDDYLDRRYSSPASNDKLSADRRQDLATIFTHNLVAFGDLRAAQDILALCPPGQPANLTFARFYSPDSLKHDNVVLIGGKKANPWVELFDAEMNFSLDYDNVHSQAYIVNRDPRPGEQSEYLAVTDPNTFVGYSVVAFLPNPSKSGTALVIAGADSDATSAAAEFLTSEAQLRLLKSKLGGETFPYFEVLLRTSRLSGTAFGAEIVAVRSHGN